MAQSPIHHPWSVSFCRVAGYGLLAIALINLIDAFIPFYWSDSGWKYNTVGILIERMPVALVGFVLVFLGGADYRSRWDKVLLKGLSWSALGVGIGFLLMIPLLLRSAMALDNQNIGQINTEYRQKIQQLDQMEQLLANATEPQLNNFIAALKAQSQTFNITDTKALRQQVAIESAKARKVALSNKELQETTQHLNSRKTVLKWSLSALITAFLFFTIWRMTFWARRSGKILTAMVQAKG
jgi:hypothetical protein